MSWLSRLFGREEPPKRTRQRRTADERRKAQELAYLNRLRREDPAAYDELMRKRLGLGTSKPDELEQFEATMKRLKGMGVIKNPNDVGHESLVRDAIEGLALFLKATGGNPFPAVLGPSAGQLRQQQALETTPSPPQTPSLSPAASQSRGDPDLEEQRMTVVSQYLIAQLEHLSPDQAAAWFLSQEAPQARELVARLRALPDEQLPAFLSALAQAEPDVAPFVAWLRTRPEWLVATVHAIRDPQRADGPRGAAGSEAPLGQAPPETSAAAPR